MTPKPWTRLWRILFLVAWGLSAIYAFRNLDRGWIPHDEGTLAQSAERVLDGQLPHRDFDELYTGGLSAMNAVAFRVLGVNLLAPRLLLFAFFLAWVPVLMYVLSRFAAPPLAMLGTFLAVSWSIPNYPAAMPSWYNLFFGFFGLAAILRYLESPRGRWLFLAGLAGGLSILMKTVGLFFVAAVLLFLAYREQETSAERLEGADPSMRGTSPAFSGFTSFFLVSFLVLLVLLVSSASEGPSAVLRLIVPLGGVVGFLLWSEWGGEPRGPSGRRLAALLRLGLPFVVGVLVPVTALVLVYVAHGAMHDLVRGLFQTPTRRLAFATTPPRGIVTFWVAVPIAALLLLDVLPLPRLVRTGTAALLLLITLGLALAPISAYHPPAMPTWYVLKALPPLVGVAGVVVLFALRRRGGDTTRSQGLLAALAFAGGVALVQFPFSGPIYLFYTLPAVLPAALSLVDPERQTSASRRPVLTATMALLLLATVRWVNSGMLYRAGHFAYDPASATQRLALPRAGGLRVSPEQKEEYERLVGAMWAFSTSRYTFATPDVPEVYFLSGLRNPTRTLFDFFDEGPHRTERVLHALDEHHVDVVVLNLQLRFSELPSDRLLDSLKHRYPLAARIGDFLLMRKSDSPASPDSGGDAR